MSKIAVIYKSKYGATKQYALSKITVFHLRGGIDFGKISLVHKAMMAVAKKQVEKKPSAERTSDDQTILETYGGKVDFTDKSTIISLIEYVCTQKG